METKQYLFKITFTDFTSYSDEKGVTFTIRGENFKESLQKIRERYIDFPFDLESYIYKVERLEDFNIENLIF